MTFETIVQQTSQIPNRVQVVLESSVVDNFSRTFENAACELPPQFRGQPCVQIG